MSATSMPKRRTSISVAASGCRRLGRVAPAASSGAESAIPVIVLPLGSPSIAKAPCVSGSETQGACLLLEPGMQPTGRPPGPWPGR